MEKRKFEITVSVNKEAKSGALRADLRTAIGQAVGSEKVVVKPVAAVAKKTARKPAAKKPAAKKTARKAA
jgi:hypothetical protein